MQRKVRPLAVKKHITVHSVLLFRCALLFSLFESPVHVQMFCLAMVESAESPRADKPSLPQAPPAVCTRAENRDRTSGAMKTARIHVCTSLLMFDVVHGRHRPGGTTASVVSHVPVSAHV